MRKMSQEEIKLQEETLAELEYLTHKIAKLFISSVKKESEIREMSKDDILDSLDTWVLTSSEDIWDNLREDPWYISANKYNLEEEED